MSGAWNVYSSALIGCGRIGYSLGLDKKREQPASHTMALNGNPRINLIAGCDIDAVALNTWHDANKKALVYRESANLYARQKLDIVTIAVNESSHLKETLDAIVSLPRLIILEKPVALNMKEALCIKEAAERNNVPILINHERRFAEDFNVARNYLSEIGELQSIRASLSSRLCVYSPDLESTGAYSLIHDGTHLVDAVLFFLEEENVPSKTVDASSVIKGSGLLSRALKVNGESPSIVNSLLNNPVITGLYREDNGKVRQFSAHYTTPKCPDVTITINGRSKYFGFDIEINGTEGRVCIGNGYLKLYKREKSSLYTGFYSLARDKLVRVPKKTLFFSNMIQNAVDFLDGKAPLKSTLQNGINALAVLEEIKNKIK